MDTQGTEYRFTLEKEARKPLVAAIGELLGAKPRYLAAPGYGYEIGGCAVDRCGTVTFADRFDAGQVCELLKGLTERGFEFEPFGGEEADGGGDGDGGEYVPDERAAEDVSGVGAGDTDSPAAIEVSEGGVITINFPVAGFTSTAFANLERLVTAKAWIIKTMAGTDELPIERNKRYVSFPWFKAGSDYRAVDAYSRLIAALCETAKKKQRVSSAERLPGDGENLRYKARCFLLSLGFIGDDYAQARKILLAGFSGNGSHCTGDGKKDADTACGPTDNEPREEGA